MPRDPKRIPELLALIQSEWEKNPDLRFFQLVNNLRQVHGYGEYAHIITEDSALIRDLAEGAAHA